MVDRQKQHRLQELRLDDGTAHGDQRLMRKDRAPFRHCPDVALEFEIAQVLEEAFVEKLLAAQEFDVLVGEVEIVEIIDQLLQPGHDDKAALIRDLAEKHIKIHNLVFQTVDEIPVPHGDLIKVCQERQVTLVHNRHPP